MCRQINTPVIGPETWLSTMGKRQMSSATGFYNYSIGPIGVSSLQKYIQYNVCELQWTSLSVNCAIITAMLWKLFNSF